MKVCLLCESTSKGTSVKFRRMSLCTWCEEQLARTNRAWCARGKHAVAAEAMAKNGMCKPCDTARNKARGGAARARAWYEKNRARKAAYMQQPEVKARRAALERERRRRNPDFYKLAYQRRKAYDRAYREAHREQHRATLRRWRQRHPERARAHDQRARQRRKVRAWQMLLGKEAIQ